MGRTKLKDQMYYFRMSHEEAERLALPITETSGGRQGLVKALRGQVKGLRCSATHDQLRRVHELMQSGDGGYQMRIPEPMARAAEQLFGG